MEVPFFWLALGFAVAVVLFMLFVVQWLRQGPGEAEQVDLVCRAVEGLATADQASRRAAISNEVRAALQRARDWLVGFINRNTTGQQPDQPVQPAATPAPAAPGAQHVVVDINVNVNARGAQVQTQQPH